VANGSRVNLQFALNGIPWPRSAATGIARIQPLSPKLKRDLRRVNRAHCNEKAVAG
jgi:hypothetical protein